MAVKKKFPYRAAVVACNGGCRSAEGEAGCADGFVPDVSDKEYVYSLDRAGCGSIVYNLSV